MKLGQGIVARADWPERIGDAEALIRCIPGVEAIDPAGEGRFALRLLTGIGPVRLHLSGEAQVERPEPQHWIADVTLKDRIAGTIYGRFELIGDGTETILVEADVTLGGKLGEFALPLLKKKGQDIVKGFEANLLQLLS